MNGSRMRLGKKSKSFWKPQKMNSQHPKFMGHSKGSPEREVHSDTGLPKKDRNISNNLPYNYKNWNNNNKQSPEQVEGRK